MEMGSTQLLYNPVFLQVYENKKICYEFSRFSGNITCYISKPTKYKSNRNLFFVDKKETIWWSWACNEITPRAKSLGILSNLI